MIERLNFGRTGHKSSRTIFGAAALGAMSPSRAERVLGLLPEYGVNHIDTAASYGDSELRLAPWLAQHRADYFLATKTGERSAAGARDGVAQSLERMGVEQIDLIQLHNLTDEKGWQTAFAAGGAVEALAEARAQGRVRFIGITGHGTQVAAMHLRSLERFPFDSVLLPYNFTMMNQPEYCADAEALIATCQERRVAVQTIKSIARRRWEEGAAQNTTTWYEALEAQDDIDRAVAWALARPGIFVNTASDVGLLAKTLRAAERFFGEARTPAPGDEAMLEAAETLGMAPLFVPGFQAARTD